MNDDARDLRSARSAYNARKSDSPLIAWTCSPEWEHFENTPEMRGNMRGSVRRDGVRVPVTGATGEINASTCHCHRGDGKAW